jgi:hypothetical protein
VDQFGRGHYFRPKRETQAGRAVNLIAQLAIRTGISPLDLMNCPASVVDEMVRLIVEDNEKAKH